LFVEGEGGEKHMDYLQNLNPVQREAVVHPGGPMLILAGAGSGKTRVLTHRVAYLVRELGVKPYNILAITFTNKAAREMQERLSHLLPYSSEAMWVSTFHSACLRMLRRDGERIGLNRNFVIYDTSDQLAVVKNCLKELNVDDERFTPQAVLGRISVAKNNLQTAADYDSGPLDYFEGKVADVYHLYEKKLTSNSAVDFDDLLLLTVRLLNSVPTVLQYYQEKFIHVLVDEYQDTNFAQYTIVNRLAAKHGNLCVVGDDDQSIYRWRGATVRNILEFEKDHPTARVFKLEQNYRSTKNILQAANSVIAHNEGRKPKELWTENNEGEPITLFTATSEEEEAYYVAHTISEDLAVGGRYSLADCAVLYRTHAQSRALEEAFMRMDIPYRILGGLRFYERREVKDIIAYLRLAVTPEDDVSFRRVINVPRRGIGDTSLGHLERLAERRGLSLLAAAAKSDECEELRASTRKAFRDFAELIAGFSRQAEFLNVSEAVTEVMSRSGLVDMFQQERTTEAEVRLENLQEFVSVAKDFDQTNPDADLTDFLNSIALVTQGEQAEDRAGDDRFVTLMSLHSAKGLEFPVVFLVGMEEGVFPHSRTLYDDEELQEERRLCYVGLTRAMEKLYLTLAQQRMLFGRRSSNMPSRFLGEIPPSCLLERGRKLTPQVDTAWQPRPTIKPAAAPATSDTFSLADKVQHPNFGTGTVVKVAGEGGDTMVTVAFDAPYGIKTLSLRYAPLKRA
jgi:DNA helicase-2/ATP-dependent DNA helicase PcrA